VGIRSGRWLRAASIIYGLVMFEVVIMLSPFAFYFYSAYAPILKWLDRFRVTAWLTGFVLPHSVVTDSAVLEFVRWKIGRAAFSLGLICFIICAVQVYGAKLLRRQMVASLVYRYIRHPQYACLSVAAFGLLTMWPRLIILVLLVCMLFAYYWLARVEERHMLASDTSYAEYMRRTAMFIPGDPGGRLYRAFRGNFRNQQLAHRVAIACFLLLIIATSLGLRTYTLRHISHLTDVSGIEVVSAYPMSRIALHEAITLALADRSVEDALRKDQGATFVAHILPQNYGMIGMFADVGSAHMASGDISLRSILELGWWLVPYSPVDPKEDLIGSNDDEYRVVFSRVDDPSGNPVPHSRIFSLSAKMTAVCIADVSPVNRKVADVVIPPRRSFWGDIKMPIF
jgi:protein-S-isoprenylcysteine O-methyltransferase Ste14